MFIVQTTRPLWQYLIYCERQTQNSVSGTQQETFFCLFYKKIILIELYYILDTFLFIFKANGFLLAMASVCYQDNMMPCLIQCG